MRKDADGAALMMAAQGSSSAQQRGMMMMPAGSVTAVTMDVTNEVGRCRVQQTVCMYVDACLLIGHSIVFKVRSL